MGKSRKYIISWNNYPPTLKLKELKEKITKFANVEYLILGFEVGEKEKTPHIQGYVRFTNPVNFTTFQKIFTNEDGSLGYINQANGNDLQNQKYCSKQGEYIEHGNANEYSENKTALTELIDDIINDMPYIDICKKYHFYILYHYRDFRMLYNDIIYNYKNNKTPEQEHGNT